VKTADDKHVAFGYAIIRHERNPLTEAGVVIPETAVSDEHRFYMVKASRGHMEDGHFIECEIKEGQQLIMDAGEVVRDKNGRIYPPQGQWMRSQDDANRWIPRGFPADLSEHLPDGCAIVHLRHVRLWFDAPKAGGEVH